MLNSNDIVQMIDEMIVELSGVNREKEGMPGLGYSERTINPCIIETLEDLKDKIKKEEDKEIDQMAKDNGYAYGKGILSNLKQDKDFVCPLCDGKHGNNAKCQI